MRRNIIDNLIVHICILFININFVYMLQNYFMLKQKFIAFKKNMFYFRIIFKKND